MKVLVLIPPSKFARNVARDLVYGCWCKGKRIAGIQFPPISQLTVVTVLREAGHDAQILDAAALGLSIEAIEERIAQGYDAALVLTSTLTIGEDAAILARVKRARPGLRTAVWGSQPTFMPGGTLLREGIDFIIQRESEFVIRDLIAALERGDGSHRSVKGIGYMDGDQAVVNPPYPFIPNLDALPIPDRSLLPKSVDYFNPIVKRLPFTTMFTTRGCPAKCTFCQSPPFYGDRVRFQSAKRVVDEMEAVEKQGYKEIFFRDEIFTASRKRVQEICRLILERGVK
ncbi:MAG: B12-binding domain-containing radical SAM protein, partial [Vicinamibacteria bacterium]